MKLDLRQNHALIVTDSKLIGVHGEHLSEILEITVKDESLYTKNAYIEFDVAGGDKYTTPRLPINDGVITYVMPNGILKVGYLEFQVVFRDDTGWSWKSLVKKMPIERSINAGDDLPDEYPDFISDAQALLDTVTASEGERQENEATRQANEQIRQENEARRESQLEGYVQKTTTINGKSLETNIELEPLDLGLLPVYPSEVDNMFEEE